MRLGIKKLEQEFDNFQDIFKRRPKVAVFLIIIIIAPTIGWVYDYVWGIPKLHEELRNLKGEKDKLELQLAPFLATANLKFPNAPGR